MSRISLAALTVLFAAFFRGAAVRDHDEAYFQAIVDAGGALPEGVEAMSLITELETHFGDPSPRWRDDFAYGLTSRWILKKGLLSDGQCRELTVRWTSALGRRDDANGRDDDLRRSFTALALASLAARDNAASFLEEAQWKKLLDVAVTDYATGKDARGHVEGLGWVHPVAHGADLLKFLGRSPRLDAEGAKRIWSAVAARLSSTTTFLDWGEDRRIAAAAMSLVGREDADVEAARGFLDTLDRAVAAPKGETEFDPARFIRSRNVRAFLLEWQWALGRLADPSAAQESVGEAVESLLGRT